MMCRALRTSASGYYRWQSLRETSRKTAVSQLILQIKAVFRQHKGRYGAPRITAHLRNSGLRVTRKRVARIMRDHGLRARTRRKTVKTTVVDSTANYAPNLLDRKFSTQRPNHKWVGDITYIETSDGWLYLAVIIDLFSRRVVGWKADTHMRVELAQEALQMALGARTIGPGLIHHTDRGSQYTSHTYRQMLRDNGVTSSMSRKGECWDNAVAESFFGRLKEELTHNRKFGSFREATEEVDHYIKSFYNAQRMQRGLGNVSPVEYELRYAALKSA